MVKNQASVVPIIQQDLSQEETILQIAFALESLEKVATHIFSQVESKINERRQTLVKIQDRCKAARDKISKLSGIDKSITVLCSSKYPSRSEGRCHEVGFSPLSLPRPPSKATSKVVGPEKLSIQEKLKFYHVKDRNQLKRNLDIAPLEGLGSLPSNISSIGSLFLFNTNQNVYKNYQVVSPLSVPERRPEVESTETVVIEPAPSSIGLNDESVYKVDRDLFYSPLLQDVPDFEVPLNLPHLHGVAGDLQYVLEDSNLQPKSLKATAEVVPREVAKEPSPPPVKDPPVEPPQVLYDTAEDSAAPELPSVTELPPVKEEETKEEPPKKPSFPMPTDSRASLMEAIRQAGGAQKLKSTSKKPSEAESSNLEKKTGNALMDDLHAKLLMRRKGISGKIDTGEGMMERVLSMIPPPPAGKETEDSDPGDEWDE